MTDQEKQDRLRMVISESIPPAHCNGCDEWHCEHIPGEDEENVSEMLKAVWAELKRWEGAVGYSNYVTVKVDLIKMSTEKAFLCIIDGEEVWLPHSQIADVDDYDEGDRDLEISVTEWIAKEKSLDYAD